MNEPRPHSDDDAVDGNFIGLCCDSATEFSDFPVDRHSAVGDEVLANSPTTDTDAW